MEFWSYRRLRIAAFRRLVSVSVPVSQSPICGDACFGPRAGSQLWTASLNMILSSGIEGCRKVRLAMIRVP